ncbi:hypothetical protein C0989_010357 [Termitomyces sp. Mn162]|nr:hypothetical protein C0989_010357 [Termitomyces sp. Mn162]
MPTLPWPWRSELPSKPHNDFPKTSNDNDANSKRLDTRLRSILIVLSSISIGIALTTTSIAITKQYGRRIRNSDWVTPDMFRRRRWVRGVVTSVGDADNFRLYHTPPLGFRWPFKFRRVPSINKELKDETIHIRIAGVDAPEVANVNIPPRILPGPFSSGKVLALEMLRAGWGTTYEQAGAEYGKVGKDEFLRTEAEARAARRGMWAKGTHAETPAEYKRRHAAASSPEEAEVMRIKSMSTKQQGKRPKKGWLRHLLGW